MAIEIAGAIYCPLSPHDPTQRLLILVQETQSRFVIVDEWSRNKFNGECCIVDIEGALNADNMRTNDDLGRLSNIIIDTDSIAYIIFTSGSTGIPKAVSRHARSILHRSVIFFSTLGSNTSSKLF